MKIVKSCLLSIFLVLLLTLSGCGVSTDFNPHISVNVQPSLTGFFGGWESRFTQSCPKTLKWRAGSNFKGTILSGEDLSNTNFRGADFSDANLNGVSFQCSDLSGAKFNNANLTGANFKSANTRGADFSQANLTGVQY